MEKVKIKIIRIMKYPIIIFSILVGIVMLFKIFLVLKYKRIENNLKNDLIQNSILLFGAIIMTWFPIISKPKSDRLISLKKVINLLTYTFYIVAILLAIVIAIMIYNIRQS